MASSSDSDDTKVKTLYSYDESHKESYTCKLVDKTHFNKGYECSICRSIMREPMTIVECGHTFCKICFDRSMRSCEGPVKCPLDNLIIDKTRAYLNLPLQRIINGLMVYCDNRDDGCGGILEIGDFDKHTEKCQYKKAPCPLKCGQEITLWSMDDHIERKCPRKVTTQTDSQIVTTLEKLCTEVSLSREMITAVDMKLGGLEQQLSDVKNRTENVKNETICAIVESRQELRQMNEQMKVQMKEQMKEQMREQMKQFSELQSEMTKIKDQNDTRFERIVTGKSDLEKRICPITKRDTDGIECEDLEKVDCAETVHRKSEYIWKVQLKQKGNFHKESNRFCTQNGYNIYMVMHFGISEDVILSVYTGKGMNDDQLVRPGDEVMTVEIMDCDCDAVLTSMHYVIRAYAHLDEDDKIIDIKLENGRCAFVKVVITTVTKKTTGHQEGDGSLNEECVIGNVSTERKYVCPVTWRVRFNVNILNKRTEAFYTKRGYTLYLVGVGWNSLDSDYLYACYVTEGENDEKLRWPMDVSEISVYENGVDSNYKTVMDSRVDRPRANRDVRVFIVHNTHVHNVVVDITVSDRI